MVDRLEANGTESSRPSVINSELFCTMIRKNRHGDSNLEQIQGGVLKIEVPKSVTLFSKLRPKFKNSKTNSCVFVGDFTIASCNRFLLVYKIIGTKQKLTLSSRCGFIWPGKTIQIQVCVKSSDINEVDPSITVLATACKVLDEAKGTSPRVFWNSLLETGSFGFVEIMEIKKFEYFHTISNIKFEVTSRSFNNFFESTKKGVDANSNYSSACNGDPDAAGDGSNNSSPESRCPTDYYTEAVLDELKTATPNDIIRGHRHLIGYLNSMPFYVFVACIIFIQKFLFRCESFFHK